MDTFFFSDYWPHPKVGELVKIDYGVTAGLHLSSICSNSGDNKIFYLDDYTDNVWTATWVNDYYHVDKNGIAKGLMETEDWYPAKSYQKVWGNIRATKFVPGYEIPWGGVQKIGDKIDAKLIIDPVRSTFFTAPAFGRQVVEFVSRSDTFTVGSKTYYDVVEITYDQTFGSKTAGARYWFAKGMGIVQMKWRSNGSDVGDILPCTITTFKGYINKDRYPILS